MGADKGLATRRACQAFEGVCCAHHARVRTSHSYAKSEFSSVCGHLAVYIFLSMWFRVFCYTQPNTHSQTHKHIHSDATAPTFAPRCGFSFLVGQQTILRHVCVRWSGRRRSGRVAGVSDRTRARWVRTSAQLYVRPRSPIRRGLSQWSTAVAVINGFGFSHAVWHCAVLYVYNANVYE